METHRSTQWMQRYSNQRTLNICILYQLCFTADQTRKSKHKSPISFILVHQLVHETCGTALFSKHQFNILVPAPRTEPGLPIPRTPPPSLDNGYTCSYSLSFWPKVHVLHWTINHNSRRESIIPCVLTSACSLTVILLTVGSERTFQMLITARTTELRAIIRWVLQQQYLDY